MDKKKLIIEGGNTLKGDVIISGAKNAALPGLASIILTSENIEISNVPNVDDIGVMIRALESIGCEINYNSNTVSARLKNIKSGLIAGKIVGGIRASILFLGPMLARNGYVKVSEPGGCPIGHRGIDYHFEGLRKMGAEIEVIDNDIIAKTNGLKGVNYKFPGKTVTGTENLIMAASLADGDTVLKNCALEPEIDDLINLLNKMGADIKRNGDDIIIKGKTSLKGVKHRIIPDRIETGTYMIAGCFEGNEITVKNTLPETVDSLIKIIEYIGVDVSIENKDISIRSNKTFKTIEVETLPYPGFPTDLQAQLMSFLTQVQGQSSIKESIFNNRFNHAVELNKMGADINLKNDIAIINGKTKLTGRTDLYATDLRASAALVLGAMIAEGKTVINNASQLFRGYEALPEKLSKLGAKIYTEN